MDIRNQIATIQIGPKASQLGAAYFHLESEQIFDEDEQNCYINNQALFQNVSKRTPRTLIYSNKGQIEALNYISQSRIKEEKKKVNQSSKQFDPLNPMESLLWNQDKIQKIDNNNTNQNNNNINQYQQREEFQMINELKDEHKVSEEEQQKLLLKENPYYDYIKNVQPKQKYMYELYHTNENDFNAFTSGKTAFMSRVDERDSIEDSFRQMLEENDYISGFQVFADCDSGYGSFASEFLDIIEDECQKRNKIVIALSDRQSILDKSPAKIYQESVQAINQLLVMTELQKKASILIPIDLQYIRKVPFFNQQFMLEKNQNFNEFSALSLLISNITSPYRSNESIGGISEFVKSIIPFRQMNVFNAIADIPFINPDETLQNENMHLMLYRENFYKHKNMQGNLIFNKDIPAFGESFVFRGPVKMPKNLKFECKFDMKVTDQVFATPGMFPPLFSEVVQNYYTPEEFKSEEYQSENKQQEKQHCNITAFPLHTALFCHESIKYNIKNCINLYKTGDIKAGLRFQEDDFSRDDIMEVINEGEQLFDDYTVDI